MDMQKEVEYKQQQEKLECEELFNNLHAHLGPQVDVIETLMVEVSSQPIPDDALTTINTSSIPRKINHLTIVAYNGVFKERIQEMVRL